MGDQNVFISPPRPLTDDGNYTSTNTFQYGSQQQITWKDDYNFPVDLVLIQETAWLDNNTVTPQIDIIACTVPLLPLLVHQR